MRAFVSGSKGARVYTLLYTRKSSHRCCHASLKHEDMHEQYVGL